MAISNDPPRDEERQDDMGPMNGHNNIGNGNDGFHALDEENNNEEDSDEDVSQYQLLPQQDSITESNEEDEDVENDNDNESENEDDRACVSRHLRQDREEQLRLWRDTTRPTAVLDVDVDAVKLAMSKVGDVPDAVVPEWARNVDETQWKNIVQQRLKVNNENTTTNANTSTASSTRVDATVINSDSEVKPTKEW